MQTSARTVFLVTVAVFSVVLTHCQGINHASFDEDQAITGEYHLHTLKRVKRFELFGDFWEKTKSRVLGKFYSSVPKPVKRIFRANGYVEDRDVVRYRPDDHTIEHGSLDFVGRDIIRGISQGATKVSEEFGKIGEKLGFGTSNETKGLDVNKSFFDGLREGFKKHTKLIVPGTLWCGDGNKADKRDDLGHFKEPDACCREHDHCFDHIRAGKSKYGLVNTGLFTRSHCDCDMEFYRCLKSANNHVAQQIGFTFFNVLGPQCYKMDYPIVDCIEYASGKCLSYELDTSHSQKMQWFDSPPFN